MDKNSQEAMAAQLTPPDAQSQPQKQGEIRHLPSPPFIKIDGLYNFRDCGGYPIADRPDKIIRRGMLYRSAEPSKITTKGISQLQELAVSRIFDLRSDFEIEDSTKKGWGKLRVWDQAVRVPAAIFTDDYTHRAGRDHNLRNLGIEGFVDYYRAIVDSATSADNPLQPLRNILSHLAADGPSEPEPILIHCSLGKDRTGVICALILSLCGVEDSIIAHEYALTALGIEDKIASIIADIRPNGPGLSEQEKRLFGARYLNKYGALGGGGIWRYY
ncbi:tyrosine phosphatase family-domain-containing protein [Chaetomium tenue]|uniref:Tyrosine phosphatase family-domain-containing protein n=1 Tax=Chaetomium tenue TaxID=1854479 RepID=A0ACB7PDZ2_9PEZI|nr:tyrosine phosphatase family-domain-containing protein [Chaetomium globosum]